MLSRLEHKKNMRTFEKETAEILKGLRESKKLSLKDIEDGTGFSVKLLEKLENGKRLNLSTLFLLAKFHEKKIKIEFY